MSSDKLHGDDTPVPVLAPGLGKTKTGRLWTYVRGDRPAGDGTPPAVWFCYSPDRKGEHPKEHLSSFSGTLQADGYAGFEQIYETGRIQEVACWAHVRSESSRLRNKCLKMFFTLEDLRDKLKRCRQDCNLARPHNALGDESSVGVRGSLVKICTFGLGLQRSPNKFA
jgi:hypothetical protein